MHMLLKVDEHVGSGSCESTADDDEESVRLWRADG